MAAMEDVKAAVGEHQRARQGGKGRGKRIGSDDLALETDAAHGVQLMYSKSVTTLVTPAVVRAISVAASASACVTRPIR